MLQSVIKKNTQNQWFVVLNALFLIGLLLLGKADPMAIVFAYVFETIIIGIFHFIKLLIIVVGNEKQKWCEKLVDLYGSFFFFLHFGAFVAIQSVFLYTAFAIKDERFSTSLRFSNFTDLFYLEGFGVVAFSIIMRHLASFFFLFLREKKYKEASLEAYMIKPYLRIFIQQFLTIIPLYFLYFTDKVGVVAAILLIDMRAFVDFYFNRVAQNPERIKQLAMKILNKEKQHELPEIEKSLKAFFEE
jgi:hypothetical protein